MSAPTPPADLLDLKMMPAWVNEPARANDYSNYEGEDPRAFDRGDRRPPRGREQRPSRPPGREQRDGRKRPDARRDDRRGAHRPDTRPPREAPAPLPQVAVRFLPHAAAFESVIAQIKSGSVAYSVFALARLFLEKPERYDVRLTAAEGAVLHQLGEHGVVATDQRLLENSAFPAVRDEFYTVTETQSEPLKGNFTNVARCRLSGTLLGPTNHHSYQPQLRNLYEQRFSRRMSFQDYQRQIEIVSDPAIVEQWKEQARSVTTYTAKVEGNEPAPAFNSAAEAERHFRQTHLPTLLRTTQELTISGVASRHLPDRGLGRVIEEAWAAEIRSPSKMMQELAGGLRQAGLNIFRHRRGMLFVSPIRIRAFGHERASVSPAINAILEKLTENPGINRKQLAEKLAPAEADPAQAERAKMTLASDLHWLVSEGYVMEFNDGTLDLPRARPPAAAAVETRQPEQSVPANEPARSGGEPSGEAEAFSASSTEDGGMSVEQSIEPVAPDPGVSSEEPPIDPASETNEARKSEAEL